MSKWIPVLSLIFLCGCACASRQYRMAPGEEISIRELSRTETSSSHMVLIRKMEPLHTHERHDLVAIVQKGHGTLRLGSREMRLAPGDAVNIPRGVPHSFVNESDEPAAALVVFTPPFDGADTVPVTE